MALPLQFGRAMQRSTITGGLTLILLAVTATTTGCASLPEPQLAPNGEPLATEGRTRTYSYTVKERVGEVHHRDSRGNTSRSTVYADKKKIGHSYEWSSYQGDNKISDDDLYHIANDQAAEQEVRDYRSTGVLMNRIGLGVTAAGIIALATGILIYSQQREDADRTLPSALGIGGGLSLSAGMYLIYSGLSKTKEKHPLPQERADAAADRYNATLPSQ
jgi:hypothetical protein